MDFIKEFFGALKNDLGKICGETISLGDNPITTLHIVIWSLYIGFIIGIAITVFNRIVLGGLVKKLVDRKANPEGGALTIGEIGCSNFFVRTALRSGGTLRRVIRMVGDTEEKRKREDFSTAKFYIPEENIHRAEVIYGLSGTSLASILLSVFAFLIVVFLSFVIIPNLIQMLSNFIAGITPQSNIL